MQQVYSFVLTLQTGETDIAQDDVLELSTLAPEMVQVLMQS